MLKVTVGMLFGIFTLIIGFASNALADFKRLPIWIQTEWIVPCFIFLAGACLYGIWTGLIEIGKNKGRGHHRTIEDLEEGRRYHYFGHKKVPNGVVLVLLETPDGILSFEFPECEVLEILSNPWQLREVKVILTHLNFMALNDESTFPTRNLVPHIDSPR